MINMSGELHLVVGYSCNNRCIHCFMEDTRIELGAAGKPLDKPTDEVKKEMQNPEIGTVLFTGGEPTIRGDFLELLRVAKNLGLSVSLQTNGRTFCVEGFAKKVMDIAPEMSFTIPLHSDKPKTHDEITRVGGSWKETTDGIKNLKKYGARNICAKTVIQRSNYKDLDKIVELASGLGAKKISLTFPQIGGNRFAKWHEIVPRLREIEDYVKGAIKKANELGTEITADAIPFCVLEGYEEYCGDLNTVLLPSIEGRFYKRKTNQEEDIIKDLEIGRRTKADKCIGCKYFYVCIGVWRGYIGLYGTGEFKHVAGNMINDVGDFLKELGRIK
ncbi:MAG: hypothetical protein MSIBF_06550 [Candidatus Altiarchaeales archaeon IMC4]|nr:MAG: hypothetical protein MSIBF_06550 [Candidatus Altiarchaeales archaeon IMC4]